MTKNQFIQVLHNYTHTSVDDVEKVLALKAAYPYSQVLHALAARLSKDHGFATQKNELQEAAVYACDRTVLKEVMTTEVAHQPWPKSNEVLGMKHPQTPESIAVSTTATSEDDVAEEVIHDLERLQELKHNFEAMFQDGNFETKEPAKKTIERKSESAESASAPTESKPKPPRKKKASGKSKAQRIVELAKQLEEKGNIEEEDEAEDGGDDIIEEIKVTKKKLNPETEKQREQIQLIDQFIRAQPRITNTKEKPLNIAQGDLSTIKSGEFGDHVISETLVDILLKQGKKDKAVEVLKKLIWKFPQKKAYFAAQIEELKK